MILLSVRRLPRSGNVRAVERFVETLWVFRFHRVKFGSTRPIAATVTLSWQFVLALSRSSWNARILVLIAAEVSRHAAASLSSRPTLHAIALRATSSASFCTEYEVCAMLLIQMQDGFSPAR